MLSISSLIEFLLDLLRDEDVQAEFARDPQGVLARHGLEGVTGQDIRDVRPLLADTHGVSVRPHGHHERDNHGGDYQGVPHQGGVQHHGVHQGGVHHGVVPQGGDNHGGGHPPPHHDDPVREIHHVQNTYEVDQHVVVEHTTHNTYNEHNYELNYYDNSVTAGEDATVIQDSFNQDNDGVDNKGGTIDDSVVGGGDVSDSGNSTDVTVVEDSFNEDDSTTIVDSRGEDNSTTVTDSLNDNSTTVNDSYNANAPAAEAQPEAAPAEAVTV